MLPACERALLYLQQEQYIGGAGKPVEQNTEPAVTRVCFIELAGSCQIGNFVRAGQGQRKVAPDFRHGSTLLCQLRLQCAIFGEKALHRRLTGETELVLEFIQSSLKRGPALQSFTGRGLLFDADQSLQGNTVHSIQRIFHFLRLVHWYQRIGMRSEEHTSELQSRL